MNSSGEQAREAPIELVPYDSSWPSLFLTERKLLDSLLQPWLTGEIEHVGSTAIPGISAKPVIDIMVPVESLEKSRLAINALTKLDYCYSDYKSDVMHWFCKPSPQCRTHHLHLVPFGSRLWRARLAFRDALASDPGLATEYGELKQRLALQYREDREAYTEAKAPFIERILSELGISEH